MHSMNDPTSALAGMLPFESIGLYEQPKPRFIFKMPRVVPDQKSKFESDELFRRLSRESEVRYTGYRDRPQEERQVRFQNACREGHTEIAFAATGTNLQLVFTPPTTGYMPDKECDFEKEPGKVSPSPTRPCPASKMASSDAASPDQSRPPSILIAATPCQASDTARPKVSPLLRRVSRAPTKPYLALIRVRRATLIGAHPLHGRSIRKLPG
ncbi:hypothetical protein MTP99_011052 [Tenebrio molitor]|jgi:hypothetical protein|nr:hypothetical protein MTP99_011052 [Tenebrio molitor]